MPYPAVYAFAYLQELRARLLGAKLLISREAIRSTRQRHNVSSARAERELDVSFRSFEQTLTDTLDWYRQYGFLSL